MNRAIGQDPGRLTLSLRVGEIAVVKLADGRDIEVKFVRQLTGSKASVEITAPRDLDIHRK